MPLIPRYILLSRLGLGNNFIQWVTLRSYNDTQFVAFALFVVTPGFLPIESLRISQFITSPKPLIVYML